MKKILFILSALFIANVVHAYGFQVDGLRYNIINESQHEVEVAKPSNSSITEAIIPSTVTYNGSRYEVVSIGDHAFYSCRSLISVAIPNSVTSIGSNAFIYCSGLTSVTIPNSVTSIGDWAFVGCTNLTSVTLPNSITSISDSAFGGCSSLKSVTIPNSVTAIGKQAFDNCSSLTSITIPNSVISIGNAAFSDCSNLTNIFVEEGNKYFASDNGVLYNIDKTEIIQCPGANTYLQILTSVKRIGDSAFRGCIFLTSVTIPNSVTSIGGGAFWNCSGLTSLTIPNSVTSIENGAFGYCSSLTSFTIPNSVTSIGMGAFVGCSGLTSVTISNSLTTIEQSVFESCESLTSVTIPNSVTRIEANAFSFCRSLALVTIPNSVKSIDWYAFGWCTKIQEIYSYNPEPPTCQSYTFFDVPTDATVYVPYGSIPDYSSSEGWTHFFNFVETDNFPNAVEGIFEDTESGSKNVYNIQGVCVKRDATQSDIDALPSGLYIIGGKKVVIK